jgi:hypothetical protein
MDEIEYDGDRINRLTSAIALAEEFTAAGLVRLNSDGSIRLMIHQQWILELHDRLLAIGWKISGCAIQGPIKVLTLVDREH